MRTSAENLYAAGDASQGINILSGEREWFGAWQSACLQGRTAGRNMAGRDAAYGGSMQEHISPFFDWVYAQIGNVQASDARRIELGDPRQGGYALLAFEGDVLVGVSLINCTGFAGALRSAIVRRSQSDGPLRVDCLPTGSEAAHGFFCACIL
jgi:NADPH-dependent 2,4-dienoyl-CoA reductase/sulfur reductase-like enzyme